VRDTEPWTIGRVSRELGGSELSQRFRAEIIRAPARELLQVFAKWQRIAKDILAAERDQGEQTTQHGRCNS
jgi:hypothetical protein